jgi:ribosomal protein L37AE/L43A
LVVAGQGGFRRITQGLSEPAFRERHGEEASCRQLLVELRWRDGLVCPVCDGRSFCALRTRQVFQCNRCKKQISLTAGTVFENTIDGTAIDPVPQGRELLAREGCR